MCIRDSFGRGNGYDPLNSGLSSVSSDELNQLYGSQGALMNSNVKNLSSVQLQTTGITGMVNPPNAAGQGLGGFGNVV